MNQMIDIIAKENQTEVVKDNSFFGRLKDKFSYDIKKMEILRGKYDIDKHVVLHQNALIKALVYYSVVLKTQGHKEIMGWLAGKRNGTQIEIVDAYIGNCQSTSYYTELDPLETIKLKDMAKSRGLSIVGQFHSHPGISTTPSFIDNDFMNNCERFGMKSPVQLIVNSNDFSLTIWEKGKRRNIDFIIPPKTDRWVGLNLGFINGEFKESPILFYPHNGYMSSGLDEDLLAANEFYKWLGNWELYMANKAMPFLKLDRFVEW